MRLLDTIGTGAKENGIVDLTKSFPRSGHDTVGGIVMLPRAIDKMRA